MSEILLGTCGWSYAEWEGILYPYEQNKLKQYSQIFCTAEIDSTLYALPNPGTVLGWARNTPRDFVFSAKLPQTITHKKAIDPARGIDADLKQFFEAMKPLGEAGKLACVLVQLPGFLRFDAERLETFLSLLPDDQSFAVEFTHNSLAGPSISALSLISCIAPVTCGTPKRALSNLAYLVAREFCRLTGRILGRLSIRSYHYTAL